MITQSLSSVRGVIFRKQAKMAIWERSQALGQHVTRKTMSLRLKNQKAMSYPHLLCAKSFAKDQGGVHIDLVTLPLNALKAWEPLSEAHVVPGIQHGHGTTKRTRSPFGMEANVKSQHSTRKFGDPD